jgi:hypothetical protein
MVVAATVVATPERLHDEGWIDQMILYRHDGKIDQLASVIAAMNTGQGRDLLGVCELARRECREH